MAELSCGVGMGLGWDGMGWDGLDEWVGWMSGWGGWRDGEMDGWMAGWRVAGCKRV